MGLSKSQVQMVAVLLIGTLLVVLNQTLVSPALPVIMRDLQIGATTVQWLTSGYSLVEAVIIPLSAYLMGRFSTRKLYLSGLLIFGVGSLFAAISPNFYGLLLGRVLQAVAAGIFMPMVFTLIMLIFPREKRGSGMGLVTLIIGFAPAIGPTVSGVLVDSIGWRALFVLITVITVLIIVAAFFALENFGQFDRITFDKLSVVLCSVGLVCVLYGFSTFASSSNIALTLAMIAVGALVLFFFVKRQLKLETPLLEMRVLKVRNYRVTVLVAMANFGTLAGLGTLLPLYIQVVRGYSALDTGLVMLPGAVLGAVVGLIAGRMFDRFGARKCVLPAIIVFFGGTLGMVFFFNESADLVLITGIYLVLSLGMQFLNTPMNTWGINSLDNRVIQHANALMNTLNQVAASFMTAVIISVSSLGWLVVPDADPAYQNYMGDHMGFIVVALLPLFALVLITLFVHDRKSEPTEAASHAIDMMGFGKEASAIPVSRAMNVEPYFAHDTDDVRTVAAIMAEHKTSGVPIVDARMRVVGFISDGDIMKYIARNDARALGPSMMIYAQDLEKFSQRVHDLVKLNVMKIATKNVIALNATTPLEEACLLLAEKRIKKVPIMEGGKLVGSLSRSDIIRAMMASIAQGTPEDEPVSAIHPEGAPA